MLGTYKWLSQHSPCFFWGVSHLTKAGPATSSTLASFFCRRDMTYSKLVDVGPVATARSETQSLHVWKYRKTIGKP